MLNKPDFIITNVCETLFFAILCIVTQPLFFFFYKTNGVDPLLWMITYWVLHTHLLVIIPVLWTHSLLSNASIMNSFFFSFQPPNKNIPSTTSIKSLLSIFTYTRVITAIIPLLSLCVTLSLVYTYICKEDLFSHWQFNITKLICIVYGVWCIGNDEQGKGIYNNYNIWVYIINIIFWFI